MNAAFLVVGVLFPLSEIALAIFKRAEKKTAKIQDGRTSLILWATIIIALAAAIACAWIKPGRYAISAGIYYTIILVLFLVGGVIRYAAIIKLGRMFTVNVAIQENHRLIETGLYKYIRHPSYTGLLIEFLALGIYFANWISLMVLLIPITAAIIIRIFKEEEAMIGVFGETYKVYSARSKRLVPGIW